MPTTLTNGIQLPDKGSVDWYSSMQSNYNLIDTHLGDTDVHVTTEDKTRWDGKQGSLSQAQLDAIAQVATNTNDIATLQTGKANASHTHSSSDITDIGDYATKTYVDNSISGLVDSAPNALDTLNELAAALNDDANFATTVTNALANKANSADLATVATSGSYTDLSNKPSIPANTSDLNNDSNFVDTSNSAVASGITSAKVTSYDSHIADTDIHVTTSDKATWNTVTSKADDSGVVHNTGNELITGTKTFSNGTLIVDNGIGSNVHGEIKFNGSRPGYIVADNASDGVFDNIESGISILLQDAGKPLHIGGYRTDANGRVFADNTNKNPILTVMGSLVKTSILIPDGDSANNTFRILSQINYANGNTSKALDVRFQQYDNINATSSIYSYADNKTSLGVTTKRWSSVYAINYYYGNDNIEFSTKFVTSDTPQKISSSKIFSATAYMYNDDNTGNTPNLIFKSSKAIKGDTSGSNNDSTRISHLDKNDKVLSYIQLRKVSNGSSDITLYCSTTDTNNQDISSSITFFKAVNGQGTFRPVADNDVSLGDATHKWKDVNTYLVNGITPSSLGMPNFSASIDISSYITDLNGYPNDYIAPDNGFISISATGTGLNMLISGADLGVSLNRVTSGSIKHYMPVLKNQTVRILVIASALEYVKFIPCQGNV